MTATYTLLGTDDNRRIDFAAPGEDIEIIIPDNTGQFFQDWTVMVALVEGIKLELISDNLADINVDVSQIVRPNDLFYLINLDGANLWKGVRAGNFVVNSSNREVIVTEKELQSGEPLFQFIVCAGASQNIILPDPPFTNDRFIIKNATAQPTIFDLNVKETSGGPTIFTLGPTSGIYQMEFVYDGLVWHGWG